MSDDNRPNYANSTIQVTESLRSEADVVREEVPTYFEKLAKDDPTLLEVGEIASLWGIYQDGERVKYLAKKVHEANISILDTTPIATSVKLWVAGHYYPGGAQSCVIARYDDRTLLWLDNHKHHKDFNTFWQTENIQFDNAFDMATFVVATKFHYVGEPGRMLVVRNVDDIPHRYLKYFQESKYEKELAEYKKRLSDVAPLIDPPKIKTEKDTIHLTFCAWFNVVGRLYQFDCKFDSNQWDFKTAMLGEWLGDSFMPR